MIFVAYLLDRGVIHLSDYSRRKNTENLPDFLENTDEETVVKFFFGKLFPALRKEFNGSMFGNEIEEERKLVGAKEIRLLRSDDLGTNQPSLGFWAYDFPSFP